MRIFLVAASAMLTLWSCSTNKKFFSGSDIYYLKHNPAGTDSLYRLKIDKSFKAKVEEKGEIMIITPKNTAIDYNDTTYFDIPNITTTRTDGVDHTISESQDIAKDKFVSLIKKKGWEPRKQLKMFDSKFALQTLAIPMKVRRRQANNNLPTQADGSFTFGVAPGWKFNYSVFKERKTIFGLNFDRYSITPGALIGVGTTDLKKGTTSKTIDRKEPIFTTGFYLMFGFNNINVGYVLGRDVSIGDARSDWYYHRKWWWGIALGIDIIK